jgi:hypothetical protein
MTIRGGRGIAALAAVGACATLAMPARAGEEAPSSDGVRVTLDAGLGAARYGGGLGEDWGIGKAFKVRAGLAFNSVLGLDAGYFGARHSPAPGERASTNALDVALRLTLPTPVLRPFVSAGVGAYTVTLRDELSGSQRVGPRFATEVPLTGGIELGIADKLSLELEGSERLLFAGGLGTVTTSHPSHLRALTLSARISF